MTDLHPDLIEGGDLDALINRWGRLWSVSDLAAAVSVEFSGRLKASLGRCNPATGRIRLAAHLQSGPPDRFHEALCHEVAHVAVHRLHGPGAKPHGPEWADLVKTAGFEPRVRAPRDHGSPTAHTSPSADRTPIPDGSQTPDPTPIASGDGAPITDGAPTPTATTNPPERNRARTDRTPLRYEHRCPVCHTVRFAKRPVTTWRCADCLDAGLPGEMVIHSVPTDGVTRER